ncbi:MAG: hypothetical protein HKN36_06440 [Hellea sp.]|nr:hypothetical protein [Hellea sp.]
MAKRQVSIGTKTAYGMGNSLLSVKNMLFHFFFLFYFSNILGVSEGLILLATMIALMVDAFTDPIMGQITDNYRSDRWGRRHKFMLWGIVPTAMALALLFMPPDGLGQAGLFAWMLFFLLAVRLGLTVYGVPYYSLGAELSTDYNERTNIISVREFFNTLFNLSVFFFGLVVFLPQTEAYEDGMMNAAGYKPFAITFAIVGALGALIAVWGTRKKIKALNKIDHPDPSRWQETFKEMRKAAQLPSFVWASLGYGAALVLYGIGSALSFYMGVYLWQFSQIEKFLVAMTPLLTLIPAVILASVLAAKYDKKPTALVFGAVYLLCNILPYGLYLIGALPDIGTQDVLILICAFNALGFMGLTGMIVIANSMLADVADEMELSTGRRQEGILYAAFSFAQKMTFALGTMIAIISLMIINFPQQKERSDVAQNLIDGLAWVSLVNALIFGLLALLCFARYPLTRARHKVIQEALSS